MIFDLGIKILIPAGVIFFFIFWYLSTVWTAAHVGDPKRAGTALIVSFFYTFKFFLIGSIILAISSFLFEFIPGILRFLIQ